MFSFTWYISIESKHEVTILGGLNEFVVKFYGPQGSKYMTQPFYKNKLMVGNTEMTHSFGVEEVMSKSKWGWEIKG